MWPIYVFLFYFLWIAMKHLFCAKIHKISSMSVRAHSANRSWPIKITAEIIKCIRSKRCTEHIKINNENTNMVYATLTITVSIVSSSWYIDNPSVHYSVNCHALLVLLSAEFLRRIRSTQNTYLWFASNKLKTNNNKICENINSTYTLILMCDCCWCLRFCFVYALVVTTATQYM